MEARAVAAGSARLRRAGQRRHRAGRASAQHRHHRAGRARRFRRAGTDRLDAGRAGSAARGRHRQPVPLARSEDFRADQRSRAARKLEGLREGVHEAPRDPDRRIRNLHRRRRRARVSRRQGRADRHQGRRPRRRQGRGGRADAGRSARRGRHDAVGQQARRRRRARRDRGVPGRRGSELHRDGRRQARAARWRRARTTSVCSTATRARTPAAWARTRPRRSSRRNCMRA